jgi:glutamate dehydrogenase (NAD(P)+)
VTGKPITQGGIRGRTEATGRGVVYALRELFRQKNELKRIGLSGGLEGKSVSVQGFGNVGYHAARILHEEDGAKIIAIGEWNGTIHDPKGIDIPALQRYRTKNEGSILGFRGTKTLPNSGDCLEVECDVLIPAALENQVTQSNAKKLRCRVLAEAANGPTTPLAEAELNKRNVLVMPDIFMNSGGVTVSYFEWTKNLSHMRYGRLEKRIDQAKREALVSALENTVNKKFAKAQRDQLIVGTDERDLVNSGLEETMICAYQEILEIRNRTKTVDDMRTAAYICAIRKVARGYLELGIFP